MKPDSPEIIRVNNEYEKPYDQAVCSLPGCDNPLYITWTANRPVFLADTSADLASVGDAETSWQVECEGGHVLLFPIDSGADSYTFGDCKCEDDPSCVDEEWCEHFDIIRLRRVIGGGMKRP